MPPSLTRRVPLDVDEPCWLWTAVIRKPAGYGEFMLDGQTKYAHRVAYQLHVGPIPRGWEIDHVCHGRAVELGECVGGNGCVHRRCWNPAHLEAVSSRENSMRGNHPLFAVRRSDRCASGKHDMTDPVNVIENPNGTRRCKPCAREYQRARRKALRSRR